MSDSQGVSSDERSAVVNPAGHGRRNHAVWIGATLSVVALVSYFAFFATFPTLRNTILANNTAGNVWNPWNIRRTVLDGGGNLQWPPTRPNGQDEPPATATVQWAEPMLLTIGDHGGPTATMPPDDFSPAIGGGVTAGAPTIDQRGRARRPPLEMGAYETP